MDESFYNRVSKAIKENKFELLDDNDKDIIVNKLYESFKNDIDTNISNEVKNVLNDFKIDYDIVSNIIQEQTTLKEVILQSKIPVYELETKNVGDSKIVCVLSWDRWWLYVFKDGVLHQKKMTFLHPNNKK